MTVNTAKVKERRRLHFASMGDIAAEVDRLAGGEIHTLGNWSPGQIFKHLGVVMDQSIDGFSFQFALPMRIMAKMFKRRLLTMRMSAGFRLPMRASYLLPPPVTQEEGLQVIQSALSRQKTETKRMPSPVFGPMTLDEWNQLHCRHAELHLGFLVPKNLAPAREIDAGTASRE